MVFITDVKFSSSVAALQELKLGNHAALFYRNRREQFEAMMPYVRCGERCFYVVGDNSVLIVREAMKQFGIDVDRISLNSHWRIRVCHDPGRHYRKPWKLKMYKANVLPESFYAVAIGVSLATAVVGPMLTRRSESICSWVEANEPKPLRETIAFYHRILTRLHDRSSRSLLWRLISRKAMFSAIHVAFVSAIILFSKPLYELALAKAGKDLLFPNGLPILFWTGFGIFMLGPVIIVWRNMEALAMIFAEGATRNLAAREVAHPVVQTISKTVVGIVLLAWFLILIPFGPWVFWTLFGAAAILLVSAPVFWRRLVRLHSMLEFDFRDRIKTAATLGATSGLPVSVLERPQEWQLQIDEVILPFSTDHAGRKIAELGIRKRLGCSIMAIDRQGYLIANPSADERLFAGDKLLLLGTAEQLVNAEQFLRGAGGTNPPDEFEEVTMEPVEFPEGSDIVGKSLVALNLFPRFGVQVCGIERNGERILVPASEERIVSGDKLLLLSSRRRIEEFRSYLWRGPVE